MSKNLQVKAKALEGSLNYLFPSVVFTVEEDFLRGVQKMLIFWSNGPSEDEVRKCAPVQGELRNHSVALIFHKGQYINVHATLPPVTGKAPRSKSGKVLKVQQLQLTESSNLSDERIKAKLIESRKLQKSLGKISHRSYNKSRTAIVRVSRTQMEMFGPGENKLSYQGKLSFTR